ERRPNASIKPSRLAPPPIQLPAIVENPLHISSSPKFKISGKAEAVRKYATGPPIITPKVPAKNIITDLPPSLRRPGISIPMVNKTRQAGNKYLEVTEYKPDSSPLIILKVFNIEGIR